MRTVVAVVCVLISFGVCADEYDECVLAGMKGVSSETGARLVAQACKNKISEAKKNKRTSLGTDLDLRDYRLTSGGNSVQRHEHGFISQALENRSSAKTITYVALTIRDGDFYDFKLKPAEDSKPAGNRQHGAARRKDAAIDKMLLGMNSIFAEMERPKWEQDRTHVYYYRMALKPGKTIRLKFPPSKSETFYSEVTTILGRESKWADTMQQFKDDVSPEARDPLE